MRINLTKKDLINSIYMQLGFQKSYWKPNRRSIINYFRELIKNKKVKISNFGTFTLRRKKQRIGRNPKTLEKKLLKKEM